MSPESGSGMLGALAAARATGRGCRNPCLALMLWLASASPLLAAEHAAPVTYRAPLGGHQGLAGAVQLYDRSHTIVIGINC